jgi:hypothetical protein
MSVIIGETPRQEPRDGALVAHHATELAAEWPLSITLWIYFDQAPGQGATHTILWYGKQQSISQHLVLEATPNATSGFDITATLRGSTGFVSAVAAQTPIGEWVMLTVVAAEEGGASHRVTLFIDDVEADTAATNIGTTTPDEYDHVGLGVDNAGDNFGRFRAEHVAIWPPDSISGEPLSASQIEELYEERWVPIDLVGGLPIGRSPGIAYWMLGPLGGRHRSG